MADSHEYVSKDTFDAHMQRIDQRFEAQDKLIVERLDKMQAVFEKTQAQMERTHAQMEQSQAQFARTIENSFAELKGEVKAMNARLDTMQQQYSWKIGWLGSVFTFCGAALAVYPLLSQYLKPEWIMAVFGVGGLGIVLISLLRKNTQ